MKSEVASQRSRSFSRRALTVGAAGLGLAAALGATWWFRAPLASGLIRWQLAQQGVDSDFRIERLDLAGADLAAVQLGPQAYPEAAVLRAELRFAWRPLPALDSVRLIEPRLRARIDERGVSLGSLDAFFKEKRRRRPELPRCVFEIVDGRAIIETPFGTLPVSATSGGRIGKDFRGEARLGRANRVAGTNRLSGLEGLLQVGSNENGLVADLNLGAADFARLHSSGEDVRLSGRLAAPNDLSSAAIDLSWSADRLAVDEANAGGLRGAARLQGDLQEQGLAFADWRASARLDAVALNNASAAVNAPHIEGAFAGEAHGGRGSWSVAGKDARFGDWRAASATGTGRAVLEFGDTIAATSTVAFSALEAELTSAARSDLQRRWPELGGTPFATFMNLSAGSADRALRNFRLDIPLTFTLRNGESAFTLSKPVEARAASGAVARLRPLRSDAPILTMRLGDGVTSLASVVELSGGGLPVSVLTIDRFSRARNDPVVIGANLALADWRPEPASSIAATNLRTHLTLRDGVSELRVSGPVDLTGFVGAVAVRRLAMPLDLSIGWGGGLRVAPREGRCVNARFGELSIPGVLLRDGAAEICPVDGAFFSIDAQDRAAGGFVIANPAFSGHIAGQPAQRARLAAQRIVGRFNGDSEQTTLDVVADAPLMNVRLAEGRDIAVRGARLTAQTRSSGGSWRADGAFENGQLQDPALPADVGDIAARWTAEPRGTETLIRFSDGTARLTDRPPQEKPADYRPPFNPLRLTGVSADLVDGRLVGRGDVRLEDGNRTLAAFEATHDLDDASGGAHVRAHSLAFSEQLQPFEISELFRGVVEQVTGSLSADVNLQWSAGELAATGRVATSDMSLASAKFPVVKGLSGEIVFNDLFTLATPPGQELSIRALNPGVEVRDGVVRFQLLGDGRVALEGAAWPFAGGSLTVAPTTLTMGSLETRFNVELRDIDVAVLLAELKAPDLTATGRVQGEFPLILTPTAAIVQNGVLRAAEGGGTIAYVGRAREEATGLARIAFEALTSFRYDTLALELNGDLGGDVIAAIVFTGHNQAAVNMTSVTPGGLLPVVGRPGIPFRFNVRVTAPFRTLVQTAAGVSDPGIHVRRALDPVLTPPPEPVDPPAPSPR